MMGCDLNHKRLVPIEIEKTFRCIDPQATLCGSPRNDW
jgi:hypothetical protein